MLKAMRLLHDRGAWHWNQAWLTEALLLTVTPVTPVVSVRVRTVRLSALGMTHLSSRSPLHGSAFVKGCPLVAAWVFAGHEFACRVPSFQFMGC